MLGNSTEPPSSPRDGRRASLGMHALTVVLTPFVLAYLGVRWAWLALPRFLRSVGQLVREFLGRIAAVLRAAGHALAEGLRAIGRVARDVGAQVLAVVRSGVTLLLKPVRWLAAVIRQILLRLVVLVR